LVSKTDITSNARLLIVILPLI